MLAAQLTTCLEFSAERGLEPACLRHMVRWRHQAFRIYWGMMPKGSSPSVMPARGQAVDRHSYNPPYTALPSLLQFCCFPSRVLPNRRKAGI